VAACAARTELFPYLKIGLCFRRWLRWRGGGGFAGLSDIGLRLNCTQKERDTMWVSGW